ncbi:hypothetical protein KR054_006147, partial [Drosophila jambulina]
MDNTVEDNVMYRRKRRRFALISYILTVVFLLVAFGEWCIFYFIKVINDFFTREPWVGSIFFVIGLVLLVLFIFFEGLRFNPKINWLFAVLIFECVVLGMAPLVVRQRQLPFLISFAVWVLILLVFVACGTCIPFDLTLNVVVIFVLAVIALIGAIFFLMLYIVINVPFSFICVCFFIVLSICMFVMYHAQIINGGRFAEMRPHDYFLAALILFLDFLLMYLFSFQMAPKWSDECN